MPIFKVIWLIGQQPQVPVSLSFTIPSSVTSTNSTSPPSAASIGRIFSNAFSTFSRIIYLLRFYCFIIFLLVLNCNQEIQILTSYKNNIGRARINILKASTVGVIIAATVKIIAIAYLYFFLNILLLIIPNLVKIRLKIGI